jgi:hypothetical protein
VLATIVITSASTCCCSYRYNDFIDVIPLSKAGIGLGAWSDGKSDWWETPAGATFKVNRAISDGVPELAVFRLLPQPEQNPPWPLDFWWGALAAYMA